MKIFWLFLRPNLIKITLGVILTLASSIAITKLVWTSKVNWHAVRGFPFTFITIYEYVRGGYCAHNTICLATNIQNFYPYALILDFVLWYLVSCAIVLGYEAVKKGGARRSLEH